MHQVQILPWAPKPWSCCRYIESELDHTLARKYDALISQYTEYTIESSSLKSVWEWQRQFVCFLCLFLCVSVILFLCVFVFVCVFAFLCLCVCFFVRLRFVCLRFCVFVLCLCVCICVVVFVFLFLLFVFLCLCFYVCLFVFLWVCIFVLCFRFCAFIFVWLSPWECIRYVTEFLLSCQTPLFSRCGSLPVNSLATVLTGRSAIWQGHCLHEFDQDSVAPHCIAAVRAPLRIVRGIFVWLYKYF